MDLEKFIPKEILISTKLNNMIDAILSNFSDISEVLTDFSKVKNKVFPMSATISISPSNLIEKGSGSTTVQISWGNAVVDGQSVEITKAVVDGKSCDVTGNYKTTVSDTKSFAVTITAAGMTYSKTVGVTYVYPFFIFFSPKENYSELTLTNKQALATKVNYSGYLENSNSEDAYLWVCCPDESVTVQSTEGLIMSIGMTKKGYNADTHLNYWRSNDKLKTGNWKLLIQ